MEIFYKIIIAKIAGLLHATRGSGIGEKEGGTLGEQLQKGLVFLYMAILVGIGAKSLIPIIPFYISFWLFWANVGKNMQTIFTIPKLANEPEIAIFDWPTDKIFGDATTTAEAGVKMMFFSFLYSSQFYLYFVLISAFKYYIGGNYKETLFFGLTTFGWCSILYLIRKFKDSFKTWRSAEDLTGFYFVLIAIIGWII